MSEIKPAIQVPFPRVDAVQASISAIQVTQEGVLAIKATLPASYQNDARLVRGAVAEALVGKAVQAALGGCSSEVRTTVVHTVAPGFQVETGSALQARYGQVQPDGAIRHVLEVDALTVASRGRVNPLPVAVDVTHSPGDRVVYSVADLLDARRTRTLATVLAPHTQFAYGIVVPPKGEQAQRGTLGRSMFEARGAVIFTLPTAIEALRKIIP